jgi:gamma-glutamylcyclotransferase (GGCT)/AIG2-like uncharacterized protein YtfP
MSRGYQCPDLIPFSVFVYGTLMPGEVGYQRLCAGWVSDHQPAIAHGQLYHLPAGYPAMTVGTGWVQGWVLAFRDNEILPHLDRYENYVPGRVSGQNLYDRQRIPVFTPDQQPLGPAWVYRMSPESVRGMGGKFLAQGRWR